MGWIRLKQWPMVQRIVRSSLCQFLHESPTSPYQPSSLPELQEMPQLLGCCWCPLWHIFWDFLLRQGQWAIQQTDDWGHTLVAPLIAAWFLRRAWPQIESAGARICWWGLLPLAFGLMWYAVCIFGPSVLHHHNLRGFAVVCSLGGLGILLLGPASIRHLIFPMIFLADLWANHFRPIDGLCHPPHAINYGIWSPFAAGLGHARCRA